MRHREAALYGGTGKTLTAALGAGTEPRTFCSEMNIPGTKSPPSASEWTKRAAAAPSGTGPCLRESAGPVEQRRTLP